MTQFFQINRVMPTLVLRFRSIYCVSFFVTLNLFQGPLFGLMDAETSSA